MKTRIYGRQNKRECSLKEGDNSVFSISPTRNQPIVQALPQYAEIVRQGCVWEFNCNQQHHSMSNAFPTAANAGAALFNTELIGGKSYIPISFSGMCYNFAQGAGVQAVGIYVGVVNSYIATFFSNTRGGNFQEPSAKYRSLNGKRNYNGNAVIEINTSNTNLLNVSGSIRSGMTGAFLPMSTSVVSATAAGWQLFSATPLGRVIIPPQSWCFVQAIDAAANYAWTQIVWAEIQLEIN